MRFYSRRSGWQGTCEPSGRPPCEGRRAFRPRGVPCISQAWEGRRGRTPAGITGIGAHGLKGSFFELVHSLVSAIPPGRVMTYGGIASFLGKPGAARTVVFALRRTPRGVEIPWHRVVGAGGRIPPRRSFEDADEHLLQESMLRSEGTVFKAPGRVDLSICLWEPDGQGPQLPCPQVPGRGGRPRTRSRASAAPNASRE